MSSGAVVSDILGELERVDGKLGSKEWWERYESAVQDLAIEYDDCETLDDRRKLLDLRLKYLELGARVNGMVKDGNNITFEKVLVLLGDKAVGNLMQIEGYVK